VLATRKHVDVQCARPHKTSLETYKEHIAGMIDNC
jgi:hypothetical protein